MNNFCLKQGQGLKDSAATPKLHLSSPWDNFQLQLGLKGSRNLGIL